MSRQKTVGNACVAILLTTCLGCWWRYQGPYSFTASAKHSVYGLIRSSERDTNGLSISFDLHNESTGTAFICRGGTGVRAWIGERGLYGHHLEHDLGTPYNNPSGFIALPPGMSLRCTLKIPWTARGQLRVLRVNMVMPPERPGQKQRLVWGTVTMTNPALADREVVWDSSEETSYVRPCGSESLAGRQTLIVKKGVLDQ